MADVTAAQAWQAGRAERAARPPRTPLIAKAYTATIRAAGRVLPTWRRARTATLQIAAFGFIDYAVYEWKPLVGYVAIGASLLVLEALGGDRR